MTEFNDIVIGKDSVPSLTATVILMIAIPVVSFIFWKIKHRQRGLLPLWLVEVWAAVWTVVTVFIAVRLYRQMKTSEGEYNRRGMEV